MGLISIQCAMGALPEVPADADGARLWKLRRETKIKELQTKPRDEMISGLGEMLRDLKCLSYRECDERDAIVASLQSALLAIPGHAKFYEEKIEALRAEVLGIAKLTEEEITRLQDEGKEVRHVRDYENFCVHAFQVLGALPGAESVAVIGTYLNEPTGRDGKTLLGAPRRIPGDDDLSLSPCNAELAALAMNRLEIEHPPSPPYKPGMFDPNLPDGMVDAWKDWWNEVKAGKRTYRFRGSPIEYGPEGPVSNDQLQKITRDRKRDEERTAGQHKSTPAPPEMVARAIRIPGPGILTVMVAVGLLAATGVTRWARGRWGGSSGGEL